MSNRSLDALFRGELVAGRYRVQQLISEGGFGAVFWAQAELLGEPLRDVALKITRQTDLDSTKASQVFGDAIALVRIYEHITDPEAQNCIVPVYDLGVLDDHDRRGYVVMRLIRGSSLDEGRFVRPDTLGDEIRRHKRGMMPDVALKWFAKLCRGMAAVHDLNVIHRDLKPANILLTHTADIRIVDFGLAASLNRLGYVSGQAGTWDYMAPETVLRQESDKSSDVYSLGLLLYEMLTGVHPFKGVVADLGKTPEERLRQTIQRRVSTVVEPPSSRNRDVQGWVDDIVLDCLEPCPIDRSEGGPVELRKGPLAKFFADLLGQHRQEAGKTRQRPRDARELLTRLEEKPKEAEKLPRDLQARERALRRQIQDLEGRRGQPRDRQWLAATMALVECLIKQDRKGVHKKGGEALEIVTKKLNIREDLLKILGDRKELDRLYEKLAGLYESSPSLEPFAQTYRNMAEGKQR